jgi:hypothetical protein
MIVDRFVNIACQAANLAANASKSGFEDVKDAVAATAQGGLQQPVVIVATGSTGSRAGSLLLDLIMFIILLVIILVIGLWLWNNLAAKYITIFKPLPSVWHLLGLIIIIDLIHPGCQCGVKMA